MSDKPVKVHHVPFDLSNVKIVDVHVHNESPYQLTGKTYIQKTDDGTLEVHVWIKPKNEA